MYFDDDTIKEAKKLIKVGNMFMKNIEKENNKCDFDDNYPFGKWPDEVDIKSLDINAIKKVNK